MSPDCLTLNSMENIFIKTDPLWARTPAYISDIDPNNL